jgi:hypothetical protein
VLAGRVGQMPRAVRGDGKARPRHATAMPPPLTVETAARSSYTARRQTTTRRFTPRTIPAMLVGGIREPLRKPLGCGWLLFRAKTEREVVTDKSSPLQMAATADFTTLDTISDKLLRAVNEARLFYEQSGSGLEEYRRALRKHNKFAISKPLRSGQRMEVSQTAGTRTLTAGK